VVVALLIARNWAYVTTYRLYLDHRVGAADRSSAAQQFDIEQSRVVPQIVTRGPDSPVVYDRRAAGLHRPRRAAAGPPRRVRDRLARGRSPPRACGWSCRFGDAHRRELPGRVPASVELVSDDAVSWVDPRVVRGLHIRRHLIVLVVLVAGFAFFRSERGAARLGLRLVVITVSALGACLAAEVGLRALGDTAPGGIMTERHDLGEVTRDPRWMDSRRYGRRLRPKVDVINEWRHGDIVRMGYVPPSVIEGSAAPIPFPNRQRGLSQPRRTRTLRDRRAGRLVYGCHDDGGRGVVAVAARKRLGMTVQNYGTAGFGPQQEELVLEDFVARHQPRVVVLAYFAGNDLFDAEAFDEFQRSGAEPRTAPGWRIKEVVSRADTWFLTSAVQASIRWIGKPHDPPLAAAAIRTARARRDAERWTIVRSGDVHGAGQRPRCAVCVHAAVPQHAEFFCGRAAGHAPAGV